MAAKKTTRAASGKVAEHHDAKASAHGDAVAEKHRTMVYLPKPAWRRLKIHLAHTDESLTGFIERAVDALLDREERARRQD